MSATPRLPSCAYSDSLSWPRLTALVAVTLAALLTLSRFAAGLEIESLATAAIFTYTVRQGFALAVNPVSGVVYASVDYPAAVCAYADSTAVNPGAELGCVDLTHADYGNVGGSMAVSLDGLTVVMPSGSYAAQSSVITVYNVIDVSNPAAMAVLSVGSVVAADPVQPYAAVAGYPGVFIFSGQPGDMYFVAVSADRSSSQQWPDSLSLSAAVGSQGGSQLWVVAVAFSYGSGELYVGTAVVNGVSNDRIFTLQLLFQDNGSPFPVPTAGLLSTLLIPNAQNSLLAMTVDYSGNVLYYVTDNVQTTEGTVYLATVEDGVLRGLNFIPGNNAQGYISAMALSPDQSFLLRWLNGDQVFQLPAYAPLPGPAVTADLISSAQQLYPQIAFDGCTASVELSAMFTQGSEAASVIAAIRKDVASFIRVKYGQTVLNYAAISIVQLADSGRRRLLITNPTHFISAIGYTGSYPSSSVSYSCTCFAFCSSGRRRLLQATSSSSGDLTVIDILQSLLSSALAGTLASSNANISYPSAQFNAITAYSPHVASATPLSLSAPAGVAVDSAGNVYIADAGNERVVRQAANGQLNYFTYGLSSPAGVAVDASYLYIADRYNSRVVVLSLADGSEVALVYYGLGYVTGVAVDAAGQIYVADPDNDRVVIETAGGGQLNLESGFSAPMSVAVLNGGAPDGAQGAVVYIADSGNDRIVLMSHYGFVIAEYGGAELGLSSPSGLAVDAAGNMYVADTGNNRLLVLSAAGQPLAARHEFAGLAFSAPSAVAVNGTGAIWLADTGNNRVVQLPAIMALVSEPYGVAVDSTGRILVSDFGNNRIVAQSADGLLLDAWTPGLSVPHSVAVDDADRIYIADSGNDRIVVLSSNGSELRSLSDSGGVPWGVAVSGSGQRVYVADAMDSRVLVLASNGSVLHIFTDAQHYGLESPVALTVNAAGDMYVCDTLHHRIVLLSPSGQQLYYYNGTFSDPWGVALDGVGKLYVSDASQDVVAVLSASGTLLAQLSNPPSGFNFPTGVTVTSDYTVVVADTGNNRVVVLPPVSLEVGPWAVALDASLNVYIADYSVGYRIVKQNLAGVLLDAFSYDEFYTSGPIGVAVNAAGTRIYAAFPFESSVLVWAGDGTVLDVWTNGGAFQQPFGLCLDSSSGNLFVTDISTGAVYKLNPKGEQLAILAVGFNEPTAVALDSSGHVYVADYGNGRVVKLSASGAQLQVFSAAGISAVTGVAVDSLGNVYLSNNGNNTVDVLTAGGRVRAVLTDGMSDPHGLAINPHNNDVLLADTGNNRLLTLPAAVKLPHSSSSSSSSSSRSSSSLSAAAAARHSSSVSSSAAPAHHVTSSTSVTSSSRHVTATRQPVSSSHVTSSPSPAPTSSASHRVSSSSSSEKKSVTSSLH